MAAYTLTWLRCSTLTIDGENMFSNVKGVDMEITPKV